VQSINQLKNLRYTQQHTSHADQLSAWITTRSEHFDQDMPQPFTTFASPGQYNGVRLQQRLLRALFFRVMEGLEPYMQKIF
jgi:hypothetical protein